MTDPEPYLWDDPETEEEADDLAYASQAADNATGASDAQVDAIVSDDRVATITDEQTVIASVLAGTAEWDTVRRLRRSDFKDPFLAVVWTTMCAASVAGAPTSPRVIVAMNPSIGHETLVALSAWASADAVASTATDRIVSRSRMTATAEALRAAAQSLERRLQGRGQAGSPPWQTEIGEAMAVVADLTGSDQAFDGDAHEAQVIRRIAERRVPLATGIARVDEFLLGGLRAGTMLAVGGQTKVGKTVFLATISGNLESRSEPVPHLLVTLERGADDIARLKLARRMGIGADALDRLDDAGIAKLRTLGRSSAACRTMHMPGASIEDIAAEASYQVRSRGAQLIMIDYLQLTGGIRRGENDEQHMTRISQEYAALSARLRVPLIVLVQVDPLGQIWRRAMAVAQSANAYLVINRDRESTGAYLETQQSNLGDESDIGTITSPSMVLDPAGPHFR